MNKLLKLKAGEVLRNNHKTWLSSMWVFVWTISFTVITGLNEAEESWNEDVDFKEKNKWKCIKSQIVLLPVMKLFREFQVIDFFYQ